MAKPLTPGQALHGKPKQNRFLSLPSPIGNCGLALSGEKINRCLSSLSMNGTFAPAYCPAVLLARPLSCTILGRLLGAWRSVIFHER